jgi:hypothetical protein
MKRFALNVGKSRNQVAINVALPPTGNHPDTLPDKERNRSRFLMVP